MNLKVCFIFIFLLFSPIAFELKAQLEDRKAADLPFFKTKCFGIEIKGKTGFLIGERGEIANLPKERTFASEISVVNYTNGTKKWHKDYNYPTLGGTFFAASAGNRKVLGNFYGSYAFIEFPFIKTSHYQFCAKLGSGLAYTSKVYDPITDPKNAVISSHVNALICFGIKNKFIFGKNQLILGLDLSHCSNAAYKVPNIGINMPFISLGYGYRLTNYNIKETEDSPIKPNKFLFGISTVYSVKDVFPTGQGHLPIYGLSLFTRSFVSPKVGWEVSLDAISKQIISRYKTEIPKTQKDYIQIGIYGGYLLPLDHFHFVLGMGVNVIDKFQPEGRFYHRIGMRYYLNNGISINAVLRSNWAKADFAEWGIGYTFNYKK